MRRKNMSTNENDEATRRRRKFTAEYKAEVVRLCRETGRSLHSVARELGLTPSAVTKWVQQAAIDAAGGGAGPLTSAEREELAASVARCGRCDRSVTF